MKISARRSSYNASEATSEWRRGFKALAAASIAGGMGYSLFLNTAGLFLLPLQTEFGWSRTALSIGPIVGLVAALFAPIMGLFIDRIGVRPVAIYGMLASALLFAGFATMTPNAYIFYGIGALVALAAPLTSPGVFSKGVATWFRVHIGGALGISMSGVSLLFATITPLTAYIITQHGWRAGYWTLAGIAGLVALPMIVAGFREAPRGSLVAGDARAATGMQASDIFRDSRFWLLLLFFFVACVSIGGYLNQLIPLMVDRGYTLEKASLLASGYYISVGVSRVLIGFLLDRYRPTIVSAGAVALSAIGATLLLFTNHELGFAVALLSVSLIGLAHGAESDFIAFFILRFFGLRNYTLLFGIYGGLMTGGGFAIGGLVFAAFFDHFGNYRMAIGCTVVGFSIAATLMLLIGMVDAVKWRRRS